LVSIDFRHFSRSLLVVYQFLPLLKAPLALFLASRLRYSWEYAGSDCLSMVISRKVLLYTVLPVKEKEISLVKVTRKGQVTIP
jgi:hypothetical protein